MATNETSVAPEAEKEQVSQSYWSLVWWKFKKNRLAIIGGIMVIISYLVNIMTNALFWGGLPLSLFDIIIGLVAVALGVFVVVMRLR